MPSFARQRSASAYPKGSGSAAYLQESVRKPAKGHAMSDPLVRLESLGAPTADIEEMLSEIDAGRR